MLLPSELSTFATLCRPPYRWFIYKREESPDTTGKHNG